MRCATSCATTRSRRWPTPDAVLVIDETGFLKQGKASCGVARQYTGSAGKITNCQIGVFAAYVVAARPCLHRPRALPAQGLDRRSGPPGGGPCARRRSALRPSRGWPARMIERAIAAEVPFAWVAADSVYGVGEIEMALRRAGKGYVLGVNATQPFNSWIGKPEVAGTAEEIAQSLEPAAWQRLSAGDGTKGPRLYDWAYLELADLEADEYDAGATGTLDARPADPAPASPTASCAYFTTWCPAGTAIETLVPSRGSAGRSRTLRDRQERTRPRPQRDPLLARLASPRLAGHAGLRHDGDHPPPGQRAAAPKNQLIAADSDAPDLIRWSVQEIRRIAVRLAQRRIQPAHVIAWSLWRRAHQAAARRSHLKRKMQL